MQQITDKTFLLQNELFIMVMERTSDKIINMAVYGPIV
jgi:hypothetical protein